MAGNWMNDIYVRTSTALSTLTASTINWFDVDMNQENKGSEEMVRNYPAVFFKFHDVLWIETGGTSSQLGIVQMEMKVVHEITDDSQLMAFQPSGRADETRRNVDLQSIFSAINNLSGSTFNPMRRITMKEEFDNENIRVVNTSKFFTNVMSDGGTPPFLLSIDSNYAARIDGILKVNKCCK